MVRLKISGMKELERSLRRLEVLPQKVVTTAAKKGMGIAKKDAKRGGWVDQTGSLRKGIVLKGEKSKLKGKKVYQVTMDKNMNDIFQKKTKSGITMYRKGKRLKERKGGNYYYPASQEYGFRTRDGGWAPGFHFMRNAMQDNQQQIGDTIVSVMSKEIDKILK